ncbi:hypothetical protein CCHR01_17131 [Colletotrichum chrysophilum]|uniref:Uncharacterized protein n=1 Tax=Colletotrichum chrysophilum TaxID=1836956 RepID=A0AAD9E761_9PEZI|nr:hypothetical protein CCHR01_17131 [Colletotrichum chrysophilum]
MLPLCPHRSRLQYVYAVGTSLQPLHITLTASARFSPSLTTWCAGVAFVVVLHPLISIVIRYLYLPSSLIIAVVVLGGQPNEL